MYSFLHVTTNLATRIWPCCIIVYCGGSTVLNWLSIIVSLELHFESVSSRRSEASRRRNYVYWFSLYDLYTTTEMWPYIVQTISRTWQKEMDKFREICPFFKTSRLAQGPTQPPMQWVPVPGIFPEE